MTEQELNDRLTTIYKRLKWIADAEARAAWVKSTGNVVNGSLDPQRETLIQEAERVVDALVALGRKVQQP